MSRQKSGDIVYEMLFLNMAPVAQMIEHLTLVIRRSWVQIPAGPDFFWTCVSLFILSYKRILYCNTMIETLSLPSHIGVLFSLALVINFRF